ncbi:MAG: 50S ribosomal protein L25 [Ignavibacteriales bacterium]|nr:50S ribosomal protein L25 [Ignavibacteriales bacterium]
MEKVIIEAQKRNKIDKASRSALRKEGKVPAIFYSKHHEPLPVQFSERAIHPLVFTSKTSLITLNVDGHEELDCIIKDVQFDPVTEKIVHIDLLGLKKGEKIQIEVPVQLVGNAIGIKEGGILQHTLHKLQIDCLPKDIPEHLEIDVTELKLGQAIHVGDLKFENFDILNSPESIIASVTHPKVEKVAEPVAGEAEGTAEPEVIAKGKPQDKEE